MSLSDYVFERELYKTDRDREIEKQRGLDNRLNKNFEIRKVDILEIHSRALAAHCECLAMNANNMIRASLGQDTFNYNDDSYFAVMAKWGLINDKGEPLI